MGSQEVDEDDEEEKPMDSSEQLSAIRPVCMLLDQWLTEASLLCSKENPQ